MMRGFPLPTERAAIWRRAVALVVLCVALAVVAASERLHGALIEVLATTESLIGLHPVLGGVLFVLFAAVSAMVAFVSIAVLVPVAIYAWGAGLTVFLLWAGWILGGIAAYGMARYLGRPVVRWLTSEAALRRLESVARPDTPFMLVLLLQLALPSEIPGYLLGLVRHPLPRYLAALALAELPYAVATVVLGASFLERRSLTLLAVGLLVAAGSLFAFWRLRRALRDRHRPIADSPGTVREAP